jgi:hypothetical protein
LPIVRLVAGVSETQYRLSRLKGMLSPGEVGAPRGEVRAEMAHALREHFPVTHVKAAGQDRAIVGSGA